MHLAVVVIENVHRQRELRILDFLRPGLLRRLPLRRILKAEQMFRVLSRPTWSSTCRIAVFSVLLGAAVCGASGNAVFAVRVAKGTPTRATPLYACDQELSQFHLRGQL